MLTDSLCVGFTFPGIIELPGSFSGRDNSPKPHLGPLPRNLMSFAICADYIHKLLEGHK